MQWVCVCVSVQFTMWYARLRKGANKQIKQLLLLQQHSTKEPDQKSKKQWATQCCVLSCIVERKLEKYLRKNVFSNVIQFNVRSNSNFLLISIDAWDGTRIIAIAIVIVVALLLLLMFSIGPIGLRNGALKMLHSTIPSNYIARHSGGIDVNIKE